MIDCCECERRQDHTARELMSDRSRDLLGKAGGLETRQRKDRSVVGKVKVGWERVRGLDYQSANGHASCH